ncbi:MAG: transglutaminase domain-containing protein [Planctomycetota bacterium]|nr:transglutaminase domain-containing protein [Planctomycetota bacterium]
MRASTTAAALALALALAAPPTIAAPRAAPKPPTAPRIITRDPTTVRHWKLYTELVFHPVNLVIDSSLPVQPRPAFILQGFDFLYPVIPGSAATDSRPDLFSGVLRADRRLLDDTPQLLADYQGPSSVATWNARAIDSFDIQFVGELWMSSWETRVDEAAARRLPRIDAQWSPRLALLLQPQLFVETADPAVVRLAERWSAELDPRTPLYFVAKHLADRAIRHFEPVEERIDSGPRFGVGASTVFKGRLTPGYRVSGAASAARTGKGSLYDLACLLTAVYRAAGIPARLVISFDIELSDRYRAPMLRASVEFFLPTQPAPANPGAAVPVDLEQGEWIPVDITRQREFSSQPQPMDQVWEHFGGSRESDFLCPIAYHWLPPEHCTNAGSPALWGWNPSPVNPVAEVEIKMWAEQRAAPDPPPPSRPPPRPRARP